MLLLDTMQTGAGGAGETQHPIKTHKDGFIDAS